MSKPQEITGYTSTKTSLAERGLLYIWRHMGKLKPHLVLVGGMVPKYLVGKPIHKKQKPHCGSMDVDLGVSLAVKDAKTYANIRNRLTKSMGFEPGKNVKGNDQRHSFVKVTEDGEVLVDFLTVNYNGPAQSIRSVEKNLSAIQTEGLGLALINPIEVDVSGELFSGGHVVEKIRVCRSIPYMVLKALAFDDRGARKDSYDLVYTLRYYKDGPSSIAAEITDEERKAESFQHAIDVLGSRYKTISSDGVEAYARFVGEDLAVNRNAAYAAVQEFLKEVR